MGRLDLKEKGNWTIDNAAEIAAELKFVDDEAFRAALAIFITEVVLGAKLNGFLASVAIGYIGRAGGVKTLRQAKKAKEKDRGDSEDGIKKKGRKKGKRDKKRKKRKK